MVFLSPEDVCVPVLDALVPVLAAALVLALEPAVFSELPPQPAKDVSKRAVVNKILSARFISFFLLII
jgi:hypothetical protein